MDRSRLEQALNRHFKEIEDIILARQNPITGLLPASTAINAHGDYTDAWVRDNVYSILSVWALGQAYRKLDDAHHRAFLLGQSTVKLMRGLLRAMMGQAAKVEAFKKTGAPIDALHAKYDTSTGQPVVGDADWGHLQLDATSLYLLMLAQMTASGLRIIYTIDEVCFIQNLVHYISRTYCTPDYGIWERGNKINHGIPEVNASSVGMAKSALEALSGFNLFGPQGSHESVIHVVPSDIARARITLHGLLPRESISKEVDAAVLSIIGYPAYAIEDEPLVEATRKKIIKKLAGRYGCKRFLLDGHQTVLEDSSRLHYEPVELKQFEHIESEWPLFFTYLYLDGLCRGDINQAETYREKLEGLFIEQDGHQLLPELYYVPEELVDAEKTMPGSQTRQPNENIPLVWAQSLFMVGKLLDDGLLHVSDIDPLRRRWVIGDVDYRQVMVPIFAEDREVQKQLTAMGVFSETPEELVPLQVRHAEELPLPYAQVGKNDKLGITGRPLHPMRTLSSACLFLLAGDRMVFVPDFMNPRSYLSLDTRLLDEHFRTNLVYINRHWKLPGQPVLSLLIRRDMMGQNYIDHIAPLMEEIRQGACCGVPVRTGRLSELLPTVTRERIDNLHGLDFTAASEIKSREFTRHLHADETSGNTLSPQELRSLQATDLPTATLLFQLSDTHSLMEQILLLEVLSTRMEQRDALEITINGVQYDTTLRNLIKEVFKSAGELHRWMIVRRAARLLDRFDNRLEEVVTDIVIRQKKLVLGRAYAAEAAVSSPLPQERIIRIIRSHVGNNPAEDILIHEVVLHLGQLIRFEPRWFADILTIRVWDLIQLIIATISRTRNITTGDAYEALLDLPPHQILDHLRQVISQHKGQSRQLGSMETISVSGGRDRMAVIAPSDEQIHLGKASDWRSWRRHAAMLGKVPDNFYTDAWEVLQRCEALVIGDRFSRQNRLDKGLSLSTTPGERHFALEVETLLHSITMPEYRQLSVETISALARFFAANEDLSVRGDLVLDVIIGHAVRINWLENGLGVASSYEQERSSAWEQFYLLTPEEMIDIIQDALLFLLDLQSASMSTTTSPTSPNGETVTP